MVRGVGGRHNHDLGPLLAQHAIEIRRELAGRARRAVSPRTLAGQIEPARVGVANSDQFRPAGVGFLHRVLIEFMPGTETHDGVPTAGKVGR